MHDDHVGYIGIRCQGPTQLADGKRLRRWRPQQPVRCLESGTNLRQPIAEEAIGRDQQLAVARYEGLYRRFAGIGGTAGDGNRGPEADAVRLPDQEVPAESQGFPKAGAIHGMVLEHPQLRGHGKAHRAGREQDRGRRLSGHSRSPSLRIESGGSPGTHRRRASLAANPPYARVVSRARRFSAVPRPHAPRSGHSGAHRPCRGAWGGSGYCSPAAR